MKSKSWAAVVKKLACYYCFSKCISFMECMRTFGLPQRGNEAEVAEIDFFFVSLASCILDAF